MKMKLSVILLFALILPTLANGTYPEHHCNDCQVKEPSVFFNPRLGAQLIDSSSLYSGFRWQASVEFALNMGGSSYFALDVSYFSTLSSLETTLTRYLLGYRMVPTSSKVFEHTFGVYVGLTATSYEKSIRTALTLHARNGLNIRLSDILYLTFDMETGVTLPESKIPGTHFSFTGGLLIVL